MKGVLKVAKKCADMSSIWGNFVENSRKASLENNFNEMGRIA